MDSKNKQKKILIYTPVNEELLDELKDFNCSICENLVSSPVQTPCDHLFCGHCINEWISSNAASGKECLCPMDRKELALKDLKPLSSITLKILGRFQVYCPLHQHDGCNWKGDYSSGEFHVDKQCEFVRINCRFCSQEIIRKELKEHEDKACEQRPVACQYCKSDVPGPDMDQHLAVVCEEFPILCSAHEKLNKPKENDEKKGAGSIVDEAPYVGCDEKIPRKLIAVHQQSLCKNAIISCPLAKHGCLSKFVNSALKSHMEERNIEHLLLLSDKLEKSEESRRQLKDDVIRLNIVVSTLRAAAIETFNWGIPSLAGVIAGKGSPVPEVDEKKSLTRIYCIGGQGGLGALDTMEQFSPETGVWKSEYLARMSIARSSCAVVSTGSLLYAVGGRIDRKHLSSAEVYEPKKNTWKPIAPLSASRSGMGVVAYQEYVYVFGGEDGNVDVDTVEMYYPYSNAWKVLGTKMPSKRGYCTAALWEHKVFIIGGRTGVMPLDTAEMYEIAKNKWTKLPSMSQPRFSCASTVLEGKIYVCGGNDGAKNTRSVEVFDIATSKWKTVSSMLTGRRAFSCVAADGKVYAIGGHDGSNPLASAEVYDPKLNRWSLIAPLTGPRAFCDAAVVSL